MSTTVTRRGYPESGWVLIDLWREARERIAPHWRRIPREGRRGWALVLAGGTVATSLLMVGLLVLVRWLEASGALAWEEPLLHRMNAEGFPLTFNAAMWLETPGNAVFLVPVTIMIALIGVWVGHPVRGLAFPLSFLLLNVPILLGWLTWERERPDIIAGGMSNPGGFFQSFPSGHAVHATAVYGLVCYLWVSDSRSRVERLLAVLVMGAVIATVAVSRLRLGAHWPSDVAAGMLIGAFWCVVMIAALRRASTSAARLPEPG